MAQQGTSSTPPAIGNRKARTREQILQAALTCFGEKGYHQTSMDDIVAASGLSKGALYWHFKGKQELFIALVEWFFLEFGDELTHAWRDDMSAAEKLRAMMQVSLESSEQLIPFFRLFLDFWAQTSEDEKLLRLFDEMLEKFHKQITVIIEEGIAAGEFHPVNASQLALALFGMLDSLFLYRTMLGEKIDMYGTANTAFNVLLAGLTCKE